MQNAKKSPPERLVWAGSRWYRDTPPPRVVPGFTDTRSAERAVRRFKRYMAANPTVDPLKVPKHILANATEAQGLLSYGQR
jgi:hypothetical protein